MLTLIKVGKFVGFLGLVLVSVSLLLVLASCAPAATPVPPTPTPAAPVATPTPAAPGRPEGVPAPGESPTLDMVYKNGVLRGGCAGGAPHCILDPETGQWTGTGPVLGAELARRLGVKYETVASSWDGIVTGLPAGKYEMIVTGLTYRPERDEVVDYIIMGEYGYCVVARADDDRVTSWDDFVNKPELRLGLTTGIAEEAMVRSDYPTINVVSFPKDSVLWEEVLTGRCDGTLTQSISIPIWLELGGGKLKVVPEDCLDYPLFGQKWGHAIPEGDAAFLGWLETTVKDLRESGWLDKVYDYWMQPEQLRLGL